MLRGLEGYVGRISNPTIPIFRHGGVFAAEMSDYASLIRPTRKGRNTPGALRRIAKRVTSRINKIMEPAVHRADQQPAEGDVQRNNRGDDGNGVADHDVPLFFSFLPAGCVRRATLTRKNGKGDRFSGTPDYTSRISSTKGLCPVFSVSTWRERVGVRGE